MPVIFCRFSVEAFERVVATSLACPNAHLSGVAAILGILDLAIRGHHRRTLTPGRKARLTASNRCRMHRNFGAVDVF